MSRHRIHVPMSNVEVLLELPTGVTVQGVMIEDGDLVLVVNSDENLGSEDLTTLYALAEAGDAFVLGMLEPRPSKRGYGVNV